MRSATIYVCFLGGLVCLSGCAGTGNDFVSRETQRPSRPSNALDLYAKAESPFELQPQTTESSEALRLPSRPRPAPSVQKQELTETASAKSLKAAKPSLGGIRSRKLSIRPVRHEVASEEKDDGGTITIDGRTFRIQLVEANAASRTTNRSHGKVHVASRQTTVSTDPFPGDVIIADIPADDGIVSSDTPPDATLLNLPSALAMVGANHPAVGFAQWKVQEAYANLDQAEVLWLPSIQTGFSFHRHDGNYQASNGDIVDVNRSSFQYGLGAGATGAGTTPVPGIRAQFHLADVIFAPDIAQKNAWATCHAEKAVVNRQLRDVALAYMKLLDAHQQLRILEEVREYTVGLTRITHDFAAAGQGLQADADRMRTELMLVQGRIASAKENVDVTSARLVHALSAEVGQRIIPMDPTVVPIELVSADIDRGSLITSGLSSRPELKELQALVAAACDRHQRQKYAPFVPSVLLGLSAGGFGGDTGNAINSVDDRYDFDAMVTWEIRNFGFGERSSRRRTEAQVQQAMFRKVKLIDDVAREISEAHTQVLHRRERMSVTQASIQSALDSYQRNLSRIREGEGLPIEVLQAVKALEAARRAYLDSVIAFNEAQFQLQWALGWRVSAPQDGLQ